MPDYRGLFLRGTGGNAAAIGVQQGDAIRNIKGNLGLKQWEFGADGAFGLAYYYWAENSKGVSPAGCMANFDASRVVPTANENRPINKSVRYLIRAKP